MTARPVIATAHAIWIGPFGAAVDELVDIGVAGAVDVARPGPAQMILPLYSMAMRSAILRALAMSWVIESAVAPRSLDAVDDQVVDDVGHDRVEAGGRLVEEDDLGLGGDRAGEARRASACRRRARPATGRRRRRQPDLGQLLERDLARLGRGPRPAPAIRPKATFSQTGRLSNRAAPWNSMPNLRMSASRSRPAMPTTSSPSIWIAAGVGPQQAEDAFEQHRLAGARAADDDQRFAARRRRGRGRRARASGRSDLRRSRTRILACDGVGHREKNSSVRM